MNYKIAQLVLNPNTGNKKELLSETYIAQPDMQKEMLGGKIFILAEIKIKKSEAKKIINFLITKLNTNYYQNEKLLLREKISALKIEHIFESALARTNKQLAIFLENNKIKASKLNIIIGVIYENNLHFTNIGKNKALLIVRTGSKSTQNSKSSKYKIIDITREANEDTKKTDNTQKIFTNVISGSIPEGGYFLFVNEAFTEYLSNKQLIEIITALPPLSAAEQIKNILSKINSYIPFICIIIKNTLNEQTAEKLQITSATQESIVNLKNTEESTEQFLSPSGFINFKKISKIPFTFLKNKQTTKKNTLFIKDKIFAKKKNNFYYLLKITNTIKNLFFYLFNAIICLTKIIKDKKILQPIVNNTKEIAHKNKTTNITIRSLNRKSKILFIASLIFLFVFFINIQIIHNKNKELKQKKEYKNLINTIQQKQNQTEASLLYDNNEKAKKTLKETEELLKKMPKKSEEEKKRYNEFYYKFTQQLEKIRKIKRLNNLIELANFSKLNNSAQSQNIIFNPKTNKIYAGDSKQQSIYIFNVPDNITTTIADLGNSIRTFLYPAINQNNNVYYFDQEDILELNCQSNEISKLPIKLSTPNSNIVSLDTYNNNIYLLDKKDGQIYKYLSTATGFNSGHKWIKENINLKDAIDLSIDGYIYILKSNGEVVKLLKGYHKKFSLEEIEPKLKNPTKIFVSPELNFIYILEPSQKRLLVFNKKGNFLYQYTSDKLNKLKDFAIDEQNNIIYFLNNNSIYAAEIKP